NYLCCDQALEDSKGAGRMGLTRMSATEFLTFYRCFSIASAKVGIFFKPAIGCSKKMRKKFFFYDFYPLHRISISEKTYFCIINQS
ncbi:hypothetical protein, partial [Phocaeicola coprophilus]